MLDQENIIDNIKSEQDDNYADDSIFNITSWGADLSFRELITMYKDGDLLKPEIQRHYVWDKVEASFFIDSILLGLPLPSIFLAKTKSENLLIVDGFQRIMTVYDYVNGIFSKDKKTFKLSKISRINSRWSGKAFAELDDSEQKRIKNTTIHSIIFSQIHPKSGDTSLYQIFERINTSGRTLFPQEIRNCVYQGVFNKALIELNKLPTWRKLYGLESTDSRMRDIEFILRYFALNSSYFHELNVTTISLKKFLNDYMEFGNNFEGKIIEEKKAEFASLVQFIYDILGQNAFRNLSNTKDKHYSTKFSPTIFDSIMIASFYFKRENLPINKQNIKNNHQKLLQNTEYIEATTTHTTNLEVIQRRIKLASDILFGAQK